MPLTEEQRKALEEKLKKMSPEELKEFQKQQCIFCQIIAGKVPSKKIYEDDKCIAIIDINPAAVGHVLLLPKEHYAIMPQIPDEEIGWLFMVAKQISQAMLRKLRVEGTSLFVANGLAAGQRAQHFMIHIIPRKEEDGLLPLPRHLVEEKTREEVGLVIEKRMNELMGIKKEKVKVEKSEEKEEKKPEEEKIREKEKKKEEGEKEEEKEEEEKEEGEKEEEEGEKEEEVDLEEIAKLFK